MKQLQLFKEDPRMGVKVGEVLVLLALMTFCDSSSTRRRKTRGKTERDAWKFRKRRVMSKDWRKKLTLIFQKYVLPSLGERDYLVDWLLPKKSTFPNLFNFCFGR